MSDTAFYFENTPPTPVLRQIHDRARERRLRFYGPSRANWYVRPVAVEEVPVAPTPLLFDAGSGPLETPITKPPAGFKQVAVIQRVVARHYGGTRDEMISPSRMDVLVRPRQIAIHFATLLTGVSGCEIARWFRRDHATVISSRKRVAQRIAEEPGFADELAALEKKIREVLA